jgi:hypothetical protein
MSARDRGTEDLAVWVDADGSVSIDVGSRYVAVDPDELDRILDRLAADGGSIRLSGGSGRADDGDEGPDRESDPGMRAAGYVLAMADERGIAVIREA